MPTQEDINAANVELEIANDNYAALANKYNRYRQTFEAYANATPEQQQKAGWIIKDALNQYEQLRLDMYAAEDRIQQAQNRVNDINAAIAAAQVAPRWGGTRRRVVAVERPELVQHNNALRSSAVSTTPETWEDIYNSWWWNEFKKWFNNAVVDDLVLPVASALWASDDKLWILSELKIPATEREMASKYYAYWGFGKDAADAYLQYATMKWLETIPELVGWTKAVDTAYTVANSWRWIYNTPTAWQAVNRAWSNYSPAYLWRWVQALRAANSSLGLTPSEWTALAKHLVNSGKYPISSLTPTTAKWLAY